MKQEDVKRQTANNLGVLTPYEEEYIDDKEFISMDTVAVILNYNDADNTIKAVENLSKFKHIDKLIVVDNASSDDSYDRLGEYKSDKLVILKAHKNKGYGAGNNLGVSYAKNLGARYALIANPDTYIDERTFDKLRLSFDKIKYLAVSAPVMNFEDEIYELGSRKANIRGATAFPIRGFFRELVECEPVSRRIFTNFIHYPKSHYRSSVAYVDGVAGALLMVDVDIFLRAGGYDERVFLYQEEAILAYKLKQRGYKTVLLTRYKYLHKHSQSIGKSFDSEIKRQRLREASLIHYFKNYLKLPKIGIELSKLVFKIIEFEIKILKRFLRYIRR